MRLGGRITEVHLSAGRRTDDLVSRADVDSDPVCPVVGRHGVSLGDNVNLRTEKHL